MSEQPVDLMAIDEQGNPVYGEVDIDQLAALPQDLTLYPPVSAPNEALEAVADANLILIGPGSFLTSLMPPLLIDDLSRALRDTAAPIIYIDNLGRELSPSAAGMTLSQKLEMMEKHLGGRRIDVVIQPPGPAAAPSGRMLIQQPLEAADIPYRHDRQLLYAAIEKHWPR